MSKNVLKVFASLLFISLGCNFNENLASPKQFSLDKKKQIDVFIENILNDLPVPGLAVAVQHGENVYTRTASKSNIINKTQVNDSTMFFTGNISELMVATTIVKLAQEGKIELDDPIAKYIPYFHLKGNYKAITINHLLTQTGGIPVHSAMWDMPETGANALETTTKSISDQQPEVNPPGSRVKRSPYNYDILADLVSKVSGKSFEEYAKTNVLELLGMHSASFYKPGIKESELAQPHFIDNWLTYEVKADTQYPYNRAHAGSMGLHSSIADLSKWMFMLLNEGKTPNGQFLNSKMHANLLKAHFVTGNNKQIGFAWEIDMVGNKQVFHKAFEISGFSGNIVLIPREKIGVIVISNISSPDLNIQSISKQLLSWCEGNKLNTILTPVSIAMGLKLNETKSLDRAIQLYQSLKNSSSTKYDLSKEALSQLGVNLLYRIKKPAQAVALFEFAAKEYPGTYSQLNLIEAYWANNQKAEAAALFAKVKKSKQEHNSDDTIRIQHLQDILKVNAEKKDNS